MGLNILKMAAVPLTVIASAVVALAEHGIRFWRF